MLLRTHVEMIWFWIINHLNEINYIVMFQSFHDWNLGKKKSEKKKELIRSPIPIYIFLTQELENHGTGDTGIKSS